MLWLVLGLVLFLGPHFMRVFWPAQRDSFIAKWGLNGWKMRYTVLSILGLGLIIWGYGQARATGMQVWLPPAGLKHANSLFTLIAMVLLVSAYVPGNHIKAAIGHPMTVAVKVWAFGHVLAVGSVAGIVLFGSFLVWSILVFKSARQRDRAAGTVRATPKVINTLIALVGGVAVWAFFAFYAHGAWIGLPLFRV
jgi:uncharacterized membrane protein